MSDYGDSAWRISRLWHRAAHAAAHPRARATGSTASRAGRLRARDQPSRLDRHPASSARCRRGTSTTSPRSRLRQRARASARSSAGTAIIAVRRGESDRDAVRLMRAGRRDGRAIGALRRGHAPADRAARARRSPGAAMVAIQEDVPVVPVAVYGTQFWKPCNFAPCSIAVGEPFRFDGLPKGGRGYKEATRRDRARASTSSSTGSPTSTRGAAARRRPPL